MLNLWKVTNENPSVHRKWFLSCILSIITPSPRNTHKAVTFAVLGITSTQLFWWSGLPLDFLVIIYENQPVLAISYHLVIIAGFFLDDDRTTKEKWYLMLLKRDNFRYFSPSGEVHVSLKHFLYPFFSFSPTTHISVSHFLSMKMVCYRHSQIILKFGISIVASD